MTTQRTQKKEGLAGVCVMRHMCMYGRLTFADGTLRTEQRRLVVQRVALPRRERGRKVQRVPTHERRRLQRGQGNTQCGTHIILLLDHRCWANTGNRELSCYKVASRPTVVVAKHVQQHAHYRTELHCAHDGRKRWRGNLQNGPSSCRPQRCASHGGHRWGTRSHPTIITSKAMPRKHTSSVSYWLIAPNGWTRCDQI